MAANWEMQFFLRDKLFDLLDLKRRNVGIEISGLDEKIIKAKSVMQEEDVAYVEKLVASQK